MKLDQDFKRLVSSKVNIRKGIGSVKTKVIINN